MSFNANSNRPQKDQKNFRSDRNSKPANKKPKQTFEPDEYQKYVVELMSAQIDRFPIDVLPKYQFGDEENPITRDQLREIENSLFVIPSSSEEHTYPEVDPVYPDMLFYTLDKNVRVDVNTGCLMRASYTAVATNKSNRPLYYIQAYINSAWKGSVSVTKIGEAGPIYRGIYRKNFVGNGE